MHPQDLTSAWYRTLTLSGERRCELRKRAIFECCKWDPQVEDVDTLAPFALVITEETWRWLKEAAERLAQETMLMEEALLSRPHLHRQLALPWAVRRALKFVSRQRASSQNADVRVMRFDFHPTSQGWRISEVNSDVPGGYNEASGWSALVANYIENSQLTGDPAATLVRRICARIPPNGTVAMVHATSYTDDRQVMTYLSRLFSDRGVRPVLVAPDHFSWDGGKPKIETRWFAGQPDFILRFFPAEWLPNLPMRSGWKRFFGGANLPQCNPALSLMTQSKRLPLVWDKLGVNTRTWQQLLPETRAPSEVDWKADDNWVVKPALGRVGDAIGLRGVTPAREWKAIAKSVRWFGRHWVAQRRFSSTAIFVDDQPWHVCLGVYTIDGVASGIYGRVSPQPLINHLARDLAVLVDAPERGTEKQSNHSTHESVGTF